MIRGLFCVFLLFMEYFCLIPTVSGSEARSSWNFIEEKQDSEWHCYCGRENTISRIIGGSILAPHQYPWMAAVCQSNACNLNTLLCGGSLISDQFILTAAHCIWESKISDISVALGVHNLQAFEEGISGNYEVQELIIHPQYSPSNQNNDIALIKLRERVSFSRNVLPICLPRNKKSYDNKVVYLSGWGDTTGQDNNSPELQVASFKVISTDKCDQLYGYTQNLQFNLCTLGKARDSCSGDSGGPLTLKSSNTHIQIGLLSWGADCGAFQYPAVYTRVDRYRSWIHTQTQGSNTCPKKSENATGRVKKYFSIPY